MPTDNNTTQHDNNTATQYDYYYYQGRRVRRPKAEGGQFLTDHPDAMHLPSDKAGWDTQLTQWGLDPAKYPNPTFTVGSDTDLALLQKSRERSLAQHRTERQEARSGTMRPLSKEDNELPAVTITADGNGRTTTSHEREVSIFGHKFAVSDPPSASPVADAMDDASFDFSMTPEGRQLKSEMQRAADSIIDRYAKEYAASPEYKQLAARAKAEGWDTARLDEEAGREFSSLYGKRIDSDWQATGYDERWYKELNSRYGGQLAEAEKQQTAADLATVGRDIDSLYGRLAHDKEQVRMGRKGYDADTYIRWNAREAMLDAARDQYEDAQRIVDEARRDTSWGKGRKLASLGRGVADIVGDIDTWTAGFTDLDNAQQLNTVLHKVEAGDDLTPEQTALMDALTYGMAARAAHIDDVSGWYKAGEVTGESIPFILEMLVNPLSSAGSAATKTILKYGLRRYGLRSVSSASRGLARRVAGFGTRRGLSKALGAAAQGTVGLGRGLVSGVARGAGMAATTGGGRVMAGAMQRQNDDYAIDRADDGRYVATGGDETLGESIVRSFASTAFENASEMSGDLLGRALGLPMRALGKAGAARAVGSWLSKSRAGQIYRAISGNTVAKTLRDRAHVTGVFGEYLEEVYSNALNAAVGNGTWGEVVDPVQNVQTFLSLVPMQVGFGLLGLGGYAAQSYASARERRSIRDGASDRARSMMDMLDNTPDALIDRVVTGLSANASYTPQERETLVRYGIAVKQGRELSHAAVEMSDDDRLANDAYANGQSISSPAELHDAWLEYLAVREEASGVFSDEDMGLLETMSPGQALQHIDGKDRGLALELMSARARVNGAEAGIGERARDASIAATRTVRNNTNEGSGRIVLAAMGDGSRAYVVSGSVSLNDDGSIDRGGSSESLVVRDASTGKARMADVSEISSIEADEEAGAAAEEAGRTAYDGVMRGERGAMFGIPAVGGVANLGGVPVTVTAVGDDGVHYTLPDDTASVLDEQSFVDAVVGPEVSRRMVERASVRGSGQASDGRGFDSPIQNLDSPGQGSAWRVGDGVRRGRASGTVVELPGDGTMVVEWSDGSISQMPVAEAEVMSQDGSGVEPQPVGRGLLGNIYDQFRGKAKAAIDFLTKRREGVAQAALHHKDIGDIDLAWGNSKMGLEHIVSKHPDVLDGLQERLDDMDVVEASDNRVVLESNTHKAVVSKMLGQEKTPQWLLTAYEKKDASGGSSDIVPEPQRGKQNGTAPLQDIPSTGKVSALPADMQEGDTVGGSPVALSYLLEGGKGSIGSTGYFLHGVAAAFPELTAQIEEIRSRYLNEIDPSPTGYAASGHKSIGEIRGLVNTVYGERGVEIFDKLLQNADGFVPRDGTAVSKAIDELVPTQPQLVGRSLTEKESATLIAEMEAQAEAAPEMELTPANWQREFGADGMVDTPLGKVKMGENQITKLFAKGRDAQFGMIRPTLADPDVIIEESSTSSDGTTERPSSYVFVKTFNRNGETIKFFASITVKKDGMEVSVSSHFMNKNAVARKMVDGNVMYIKEALRPISSEWHLAEHREDVPDLLPTQENNASITEDTTSTGKDTTPSGKKQGGVATSPIPRDSQGQPDYERADPDAAWDAIVEQTGGDEAMAQAVADSMMADKEAALKKAERAKPRGGVTIAEKIAAERGRKEAVERAKASLTHWQRIALTRQRRQMEAQAEQSRRAEEAARSRREQEERQRAELEEAERIRREALNGVPDIVDDTPQDARARGYRRVNGEKVDRQAPLAARQGKEVQVKFDDKNIPTGHVALIEANQLQPSHLNGLRNPLHFIDEAQPKERNDEASVLSARRMAANIRPEEITSSVTAYTGAPTVNVRGEVIQGNNRSAALREMWAGEPAQAQKYRQYLTDHAADFGLTPEDVEAMRRPVLVSMVDVSDDDAITLGQFVAQDTESGGTERIKPRNVVQRMGGDMRSFASRLLSSSNDEMTFSELVDRNGMDVLKWMQQRGHISPTQYRSAFDNRGNLTAEAKNDLRGIMYQSIFQNGNTHLEEMFGTLPAKAQKAILATAYRDYDSPNAERMNAELQASISAYHALSQMPDFASAKNYREARLAAQTWQRQYAIDDVTGESYLPSDRYSNFAVLLAVMYKGQTQSFIQNTLDGIFDLVQGTQEATLFEQPDNTPRTLVEAINEAINARGDELLLNGKFTYDGQRRSNVLAGGSAASQQGRQGSAGDAPAGGRAEDATRQTDSPSGVERNGGQLRNDGKRQNALSEVSSAERAEMENRIVDWLSDGNLAKASGKSREYIFKEFGNEPMPIAYIPERFMPLVGAGISDPRIYCGKGYFIEHALRNHAAQGNQISVDDVDVSKYLNIQSVLDNPDHIKETFVDGKRTVVFIKKIGRYFAELTQVEENGKIILHKSLFNQKKEPYAKLDDIRHKDTSSEGGVSSISHADGAAPAISLQSRDDEVSKVSVWKHADDVSTASDVADGLYSSQGNMSDPATEGTDAPQTNISVRKGTDKSSVTQTVSEKIAQEEAKNFPFIHRNLPYTAHAIKTDGKGRYTDWEGKRLDIGNDAPADATMAIFSPNGVIFMGYAAKDGDVYKIWDKDGNRLADAPDPARSRQRDNDSIRLRHTASAFTAEEDAMGNARPLSLADMRQSSEPEMRQVDVEGLMRAIYRDGEAKLSDHLIVGRPGLTQEMRPKQETSSQQPEQTNDGYGANNKLVSRDRYEELKKRMRRKLGGQMNMGIDPEILAIGTEMAAYHIEAGAREFADYARRMIADLGDAIRPYLKSFYNGARDLPEVQEAGLANEMTPYDEVRTFDTANFDKVDTDAFATAEAVVAEQEAARQAEKAKSEIINRRNNERRKEDEQAAADTEAVASQAEAVADEAERRIENATDEKQVNETVEEIDRQLDKVNEQLALLGYYEADQVEGDFNEAYGYMRNAEKKAVKDANRLANSLVKGLGIDPKAIVDKKGKRRRSIAVANIAPIGGDISIYLPLGEKRELYINVQLDKQDGDNLKAKGGYARIENPNPERGEERYLSSNNFFAEDETYQSLLRKVQQLVKHYATGFVPVSNAQQEAPTKAESKQGKRQRKQEEPKIADLFSAQEENAVENQENSPFQKGDAVIYHDKPATVYDFDDDGRLVLDTGLAPVLYDIADPKEVKPANTASPNMENAEINRTFANAVKTDMLAALDSGTRPYRSILDLRKRAAGLGMEVDNDGRTDILLQELVEDGLVRAAREVVEQHGRDSRESYDLICKLYDMQPTIAARSSNRIKMQQYSTPLPMAWNAAHFAMSGKKDGKVLEPTAGNGMLVFAIPAQQVHANELDETRLDNLREQGFAQVTRQDAAEPFEGGQQYDVIIANPPFGKREEVEYDGKMIPGLDPQITLNALASMKDDGKAAIIIGGNMEYGNNGGLKSMKPFFTYLYDHYNVKGVVDMDGRLYAKQGTTYPTRMILIAGRRSDEERAQTAVYPPVESKSIRKAESFDDLYEIVNEVINSKEKTNGTEILRSQQGQLVSVADRPSRNTDGKRHTGQSRTDDTSGRGRRASVEGTQEQGEAVLRGEHRTDTGDGETRRGTGGNTTGGSRGVPEPDVQRVDRVGVSTNRVGLSPEPKKRNLTEEKLPYRPHNSAFSLESVAPAAMVEAMDNVLSQIEAENGNIDEFVKKELGYDTIEETHQALAAEQIDSVAMAIYQMKKGQALIIGDQTGVGKGRQMAALIRWAVKRGEKPIFITQKADLFSDIYRDLVDIGSGDLVPFIFNSPSAKENKGEMVDANGKVVYKGLSDAKMKKVMATGKLPDEYDYAVLTYSQVNSGDEISQKEAEDAAKKRGGRTKKSKASKDGKATPKATFLRAIAEDNYLFLDESHTAAGTSNTGAYLQSILRSAKAATFASATFAKRPDTMPLYAIRTAMSQAKVEPDKLIGIIEKGGVTLQEIMSRELTNAGQMVRRERDMSDVVTDWKTITDPVTVKRSRENYDRTIAAFNAIIKFQEDYVKPMVDAMDKELAVMAESAGIKRGTDKLGISNVPFASKTYNYTKQLMLALKVDAIANEVDTEIKAGRHPVIALESTMESSIKDYSAGEVIEEPTFSASLLRGLDTVMQYTIKDENGKEQHARYSPKQLGEAGEKAYYELQDFIRKSTSDIFISPLDAIIERLHGIGYKVGELTGRDMYVERDDEGRVVVKRRTDKDKKKMQREFNNGTLDVLILNKSASTGISLHASEKFSDQRQRTMIIAQPLSDINDYMQMIGRIDRTGQVHRGYYINLGLPVPAENRFLMMLSTKLKSLNANTTTSQDSESNDVEAPDLLNKYGSQVVVEYLRDNPEIYEKMGSPLKKSGEGSNTVSIAELEEYKPQEDDARKITGYVALLTTKEQEEFYDDVVRRYNELIKYLNDTGSNDLKITVMPLRAKTLSKRVSSEGIDPTGTNPFARNSYVEQVEMDVLRKPMKAAEIRKTIEQVNKGKRPEDYVRQIIATIEKEDEVRIAAEEARYERSKVKAQEDIAKQTDKINRQQKRTAEEKQAAIADYARETNENVETKHNDNMVRLNTNSDMLKQRLHMFEVGKSYLMPDNLESMVFDFSTPAIFCGYKAKDSKITASTTLAVFATLDGRRRMEVKLSQPEALRNIYKATNDNWDAARSTTLENWDSQIPTGTRKTGFIMTGNILQAIADTQDEHGGYPGQLISYTDIDGNVHDGILMPDKWNTSMLKTSGAPIISRLKQIKDYMPVTSHDGKVEITGSSWAKVYYLTIPKTKKDGAVYYEDKALLRAVHGGNFYPYRGKLRADITEENIEKVVRELSKLGVKVREDVKEDDVLYRNGDDELGEVNERFNDELQQQIDGTLPKGHVYSLGRPSDTLLSAGLPDLPIEMAASRLSDKSMQENHPFDLSEVRDLPDAIQHPMAVFRSATHIGSYVVMTEIEHGGKNFVVAIEANRRKGKIEVNSVRSVHYRTSNSHMANWIAEGLLEYADKEKMAEWLSKQRYNSADVRKLFNHAANIVRNFENPGINGEETYRDVYRLDDDELDEVNERFNEELRRYDSGEMDTNEMFHLGMPQGVMRAFLPDLPIVMRQRVAKKGAEKKHNVPTSALQDMPSMISDPIFVFQRDANTIGILTDMTDNDGKNVCVAIELGRVIQNGGEYLEVNDIRSFHGREVKYIIEPIAHNNTLRYANKEKGLAWLSSASQPVQQEIDKQDLIDAANIVRNFENPSFNGDNLREGVGELSDDDLSIANDPVSKLLGKSTRTAAQRRAFAERERLRMVDAVQDLAAKLHLDNVEVVTDASTLDGRRAKAKGFYSRSTGRITIVIPNHTSVYDAEQTLLHEAVAHYGLRELFGEHFDTFLDNVFQSADSDVRRRITELARERNWDFRTATEEYLASLAEETNFEAATRSGWWQKIKDAFMRMLHSIGFENFSGVTLSDNELRYILWRSYENLAEPGRYRSILGEAEDVVMQSRLKVGNYAEAAETMTSAAEPAPTQDDGDKVARIEKLRRSEPVVVSGNDYQGKYELNNKSANKYILDNLRGEYINKDTGDRINLTRKGANKSMHHDAENEVHLKSAAYIPQMIENAIFIDEEANTKDKTGFDSYRYYVVGLNMGGIDYTVRLTVGVKDGQIYYDHALTEIEKNSLLDGIDLLKRKFADKEAARMADYSGIKDKRLLSILQTNSAKTDDSDTLFREADTPEDYDKAIVRERYDRRVRSFWYNSAESMFDSMQSLKEAMQMIIEAETGGTRHIEEIAGYENAYLGENRLSSKNESEGKSVARHLFKPLLDEAAKLAKDKASRTALYDYMMAKHGLERNRVMALREAQKAYDDALRKHPHSKKTLQDFIDEYRDRDFAGLTGLTGTENVAEAEAEARRMVDEYEAAHDTDALWARVRAVTDYILDKSLDTGLLSREGYDRIKGMYTHYIPLRGFAAVTSPEAYTYLDAVQTGAASVIKEAGGRTTKADDPLAQLSSMLDSVIMQGNRNQLVKQRFLNFVLNHPSDLVSVSELYLEHDEVTGEWRAKLPDLDDGMTPSQVSAALREFDRTMSRLVAEQPGRYRLARQSPDIPYVVPDKATLREHQVLVRRGGRTVVLTINGNPRLAQALNGATNPDGGTGMWERVLQIGESVNRQLAAFYTTRNPDFVLSNFLRDAVYTNTMAYVKEGGSYGARFNVNFGRFNPASIMRLIVRYEAGRLDESDETERLFRLFMDNGGETGYAMMRDMEAHKRAVTRALRDSRGLTVAQLGKMVGGYWDIFNRGVENCARFAAFVTSMQSGRSLDRSIWDAKEISVNFNKKGSGFTMFDPRAGWRSASNWVRFASGAGRSGYVFWNAALQGTSNFARTAARHPVRAVTAMAAMYLLGTLAPVLASMFGGGDGDDDYYDLPDFVRRTNWVLPTGGHGWICIPLPVEYRAIYGLGELSGTLMGGKVRMDGADIAMEVASQLSQLMPINLLEGGGGSHAWQALVPSHVAPIVEIAVNRDWLGLPIYKDTPYNEEVPEWASVYRNTNELLVSASRRLNSATGGNDVDRGWLQVNPAAVEHLLTGYLGGYAATVGRMVNMAGSVIRGEETDVRNVPLLNRVYKRGTDRTEARHVNEEYWKLVEEAGKTTYRLRGYREEAARGVTEYAERIVWLNRSPEYARYAIMRPYMRAVKRMEQARGQVAEGAQADSIDNAIIDLKRQAVEACAAVE